jgi:hypothetical protein
MKAYGGVDVYIHVFLTSAVVWGEWSASRPGRLSPRCPFDRLGLDDVERRKFLTLQWLELRPLGRPARSQSLYRPSYPGFLLLGRFCNHQLGPVMLSALTSPPSGGFPCCTMICLGVGCRCRSLTLREEHRLRVLENRVLRGIVWQKRDEVIGGWRKLHNEELHNLCCSPSIIRIIKSQRMRWVGHVACMGRGGMHIGF